MACRSVGITGRIGAGCVVMAGPVGAREEGMPGEWEKCGNRREWNEEGELTLARS